MNVKKNRLLEKKESDRNGYARWCPKIGKGNVSFCREEAKRRVDGKAEEISRGLNKNVFFMRDETMAIIQ